MHNTPAMVRSELVVTKMSSRNRQARNFNSTQDARTAQAACHPYVPAALRSMPMGDMRRVCVCASYLDAVEAREDAERRRHRRRAAPDSVAAFRRHP
eukprot:3105532-Pleurochrysis_carterae.AAC.2